MPPIRPPTPTELELLILKELWQAEEEGALPLAVRDIRMRLAASGRELAHTSVITMLNIMTRKRLVKRIKEKNAFLFSPRVSQEKVHRWEVSDLLERVFDGSARHLMLALLDSAKVDAAQIAEIKQLINRKSKERDR